MHKIAARFGVGTGTVQRIKAEMGAWLVRVFARLGHRSIRIHRVIVIVVIVC
jgi:hypothetical protein